MPKFFRPALLLPAYIIIVIFANVDVFKLFEQNATTEEVAREYQQLRSQYDDALGKTVDVNLETFQRYSALDKVHSKAIEIAALNGNSTPLTVVGKIVQNIEFPTPNIGAPEPLREFFIYKPGDDGGMIFTGRWTIVLAVFPVSDIGLAEARDASKMLAQSAVCSKVVYIDRLQVLTLETDETYRTADAALLQSDKLRNAGISMTAFAQPYTSYSDRNEQCDIQID